VSDYKSLNSLLSDNISERAGIKKNKMVLTQKNDGILDVYIHHDKTNNKYIAWMDGEIKELDEKSLAKVINGKIEEIRKTEGIKNIETIRLLSCSDWESAKRFHKYINIDPDFDIHLQASNKKVELSFDPDSKELVGIQGGTWKEFTKEQERIIQPAWNRGPPTKGKEIEVVLAIRQVDGKTLTKDELAALEKFQKRKDYNLGDDDFVRYFRYLVSKGYGEKELREQLVKKRINFDIESMKAIIDKAGKQKADNFFNNNFGDHKTLILVVQLLNDFKGRAITGIMPKNYSQIVQDVNMKHILDKHTFEHFNFSQYESNGILKL